MKKLTLPTLKCKRCGHKWAPRRPELPKYCPNCKSPRWQDPPRNRGRPRKQK